jgi:hypothetical protein
MDYGILKACTPSPFTLSLLDIKLKRKVPAFEYPTFASWLLIFFLYDIKKHKIHIKMYDK